MRALVTRPPRASSPRGRFRSLSRGRVTASISAGPSATSSSKRRRRRKVECLSSYREKPREGQHERCNSSTKPPPGGRVLRRGEPAAVLVPRLDGGARRGVLGGVPQVRRGGNGRRTHSTDQVP